MSSVVQNEQGENITWKSFPFKEEFPKSLILLFIILSTILLVYINFNIFYSLLAFIFFSVSFYKYFTPAEYSINERGFAIQSPLSTEKKEWSDFKRVFINKNLVIASPFEKPRFLDYYRGRVLRLNKNSSEVEAFLSRIGVLKK